MTPKEVRNEIMIRYRDSGVITPLTLIALDNQAFTPPDISDGVKWVRLNVQFNTGSQDSLGRAGNRRFLKSGVLFIQIFTGANQATNDNDDLAQDSLNVFEGVSISELWFVDGRIESVGSDGEWYQQNVVLNFFYEEVK